MKIANLLVNCKNIKWFPLFFILYICWEWWLNNPNNVLLSNRIERFYRSYQLCETNDMNASPFFAQQPELGAEGYTYTIKQRQEKYQPPYYIITKLTPMFQRRKLPSHRSHHKLMWRTTFHVVRILMHATPPRLYAKCLRFSTQSHNEEKETKIGKQY